MFEFSIYRKVLNCLRSCAIWLKKRTMVFETGKADTFFVPVVQWIAAKLGMNETLAGVTIVALGNAGPDIAGGFAAFGQMNGETSRIVFNSLLSGGFFVISLLPAIICLWTPLIPARRPFLRDNLFYVASCSLFFAMSYGDGLIQFRAL